MNFWNKKNLPIPPINTYKAANENIDIKYMYDVLREGKLFFDDNKYMYAEYVVLSRIVYRMKQKFRSAKDFKALEKVNKALDNYFKMNISLTLKKVMNLIPFKYKEETYLPTKNLLDYILVRLQGLVKLMERIVETSKIAAYLLDKRIHTGHFWKIAFIIFALVSRVYVLAKYTTKFICEYYHKLLPFSHQLKNTGRDWLPESYGLPKDLKEWINVDWLEFDDDVQIVEIPSEIPDIMHFFDLVNDDDDVQFADEYFLVDDDNDVEIVKEFKKICNTKTKNAYAGSVGELRGFDNGEDIGEVIEINDSLLEENSFSQNIKDVTDNSVISIMSDTEFLQTAKDVVENSVISIMSDTDKSDVIDIAHSSSQSELEESTVFNSLIDFRRDLVSEDNLPVSDISVVEIMDDDNSKTEASNIHGNNNNAKNISTSVLLLNSNLNNHMSNSLLVSDSEFELVVAEEGNVKIAPNASLLPEIKDVEEVKLKKTNKIQNEDELENNLNLSEMENSTNEINIKTNLFLKSGSEGGKSDKENVVVLSDTSIIEVTEDKTVKKRRKLRRGDNSKLKKKNAILSLENDNFIMESDEDVITVSDISVLKTTEDKTLKKKKVKRSNQKGDKLLKKGRSKGKSNSSLILDLTHFNTITKNSGKSIRRSANTLLRDDKVIQQKKKKLKQKTGNGSTLMNILAKNNVPTLNINETHDNIVSKHGAKNNMPLIESVHNQKIKKRKNKVKKTKSVSDLGNYSQFESDIKPYCSSILVSNLKDGDGFRKNMKVTENRISKRKRSKLNNNGNNKLNKKIKLVNNDIIIERDGSMKNGTTKMKINKSKKASENGIKLKDKFSENKRKKMNLNADILLGSQMQDHKNIKKLTKKHKENVIVDKSVMKIMSENLKKKKRIRENRQNAFRNKKSNSSSEVVQDANKQTKRPAENLVIKLNQTSSNKLTNIKDKEKSTHKLSTISNLQNKIKKKQIRNNYEIHSANILSAAVFDINSRKRGFKKHAANENESRNSNKKRRKDKNISRTQLLGEVSSKQEVKGESNTINVKKLNKKKKKLKLLDKLKQADLQNFKKSPKLIDKLKRSSGSSSEKYKSNKSKKKRKNINVL